MRYSISLVFCSPVAKVHNKGAFSDALGAARALGGAPGDPHAQVEVDMAFPPDAVGVVREFYGNDALVDDGVLVCKFSDLVKRFGGKLNKVLALRIIWDAFAAGCVYT
jgi:hypothetical protein